MVSKDVLSAKLIELADRADRVRARTPAQAMQSERIATPSTSCRFAREVSAWAGG